MKELRPEVITKKGIFVGTKKENGVLSFRGIPFAQPPIGSLRWQKPKDMPDNQQRFDAGSFKAIPMQSEKDERYQKLPKSEDCLYLNVFAADLAKTNKPVLVWVYGGSYIKGGSSLEIYHGDLLIEENPDMILVTVNYRLGVFATLNLSKLDSEGNYSCSNNLAQLDLQASLKWIYENIADFGGSPDNITVFGHSAGSSNISAQLMMEESRRYFKKAIMHSSFALDVGTTSWEDSLGAADVFYDILGNPSLDELLNLSSQELYNAQEQLQSSGFFTSERKAFSVVKDNIVIPVDGFKHLRNGSTAGIDVIIGTCNGEYDQQFRNLNIEDKYGFLKSQCGKRIGDLDLMVHLYQQNNPQKSLDEIYMDIKNDLWLRVPANLLAEAMAPYSKVYMFHTMLEKETGNRAHHGNEYEMIFCRPDWELVSPSLAHQIRQTWINFVRGGVPQESDMPNWESYNQKERNTFIVCKEPYIAKGVRLKDMELLYPLYSEASYLGETIQTEEKQEDDTYALHSS